MCIIHNKVRISYVPEGDIIQQGKAKRKIKVEMKKEIEIHYVIVHFSLGIGRDLITGTK